jgi:hypothetical protein
MGKPLVRDGVVLDARGHALGVDHQEQQVPLARIEEVGHAGHLAGVRAVDEALLRQGLVPRGHRVFPVALRLRPDRAGRDVVDQTHLNPPARSVARVTHTMRPVSLHLACQLE